MEKTLLIIKPDAVLNSNIGDIIHIIEKQENVNILSIKMLQLTISQAKEFYSIHSNKFFFKELINFIVSSKIVVLLLEGKNIVYNIRNLIGNTDPKKSSSKTIRRIFGTSITKNAVHASDTIINSKKEIEFFFKK